MRELFAQRCGLRFQLCRLCLLLRRLCRIAAGALLRFRQLRLDLPHIFLQMADGALQHRDGGVLLRRLGVQFRKAASQRFGLHILFLHPPAELLRFGKQRVHGGAGLVPLPLGVPQVGFQLAGIPLQRLQIFQPQGNFQHAHLIPKDQIFLRCFRLRPQRLYLKLQFGNLIVDADEVFLRPLQLPLRLLFPVAVLRDSGGLLKNLPAVRAFRGQDFVHTALPHDGVALPAHAGVHEQLRHVFQPGGLAIDVIFALSAAIIAPGDRHLRLL